ncbi:MAG: GyrI-like domain-containing protein, partial [Planctomycetota bacterium]|nr:GyrI-like domain-containing protein [Planctomycetota bacterium]
RGLVGEPLATHVRRLRLERAALLLRTGQEPIIQIALDSAYDSHEAFTRAFNRAFGISPSRYRDGEPPRHLPAPSHTHFQSPNGGDITYEPIQYDMSSREIQIKTYPKRRVAFLRHVGPYIEVGPTWGRFCGMLGPLGLLGPETKIFGAPHDDPDVTPPDKLRYDACVEVDDSFEPKGELGVQELGGGKYAVLVHEGPYENFGQSYGELYARQFSDGKSKPGEGPCLEFYLNSPEDTAPADLRSEIWVPLAE